MPDENALKQQLADNVDLWKKQLPFTTKEGTLFENDDM